MNFDETSEKLKDICDKVWVKIEDLMVTVNDKHTLEDLRQLEKDISDNFKLFCVKSEDYKSYLQRQNTKEALEILEDHKEHFNSCIGSVRQVTDNIKVIKREIVETLSQVSRSSKSTASRKRAKAEAEKVRLDYVRKESELLKQKADIEANLNIVKQESIIAVTETEAKILEGYDDQELDLPSAHVDKQESVKQYIEQLDIDNYVPNTTTVSDSNFQFNTSTTNVTATSVSKVQMQSTTQPVYTFSTSKPVVPTYYPPPPTSTHLINMATSVPTSSTQVVNSDSSMNNVMSDITRFMLRKDLLLSRFSNFDDSPETYMSWKASFQSIIKELGITPFEEMDLLVKWLGPESSRFARSLRAANAHDPPRGLRQIWERLEERYGRPEMIEHSLKRKLNNFPTLNNKDNKKMYDLVDILTEVESAMVNPACSTLLSYFNSSSGVAPIVSKLPFSLQDKWATRASSYKQSRGVSYPPFSYFVKFVKEMCEIRNDPAFNQTNTNQSTKQSSNTKVVTRKTDLKSENSVRCPLHKAGHSLNECFAFRKRPLSDRQKFLKEKRICFRCCEATDHISRNCKAPISCSVCKSNRHSSAMHVNSQVSGPSADSQTLDKTVETDGGEQNKSTVVNACTELCGDNRFGRSCGKTVLVDVFSDKSLSPVRVYAIIDDQSNRTLAAPTLFDRLGIRGTASNFTLSSCSGSHMMTGRRSDLRIDSVDGKTSFNLSDVIECDSIPNELLEIPTPDVARAHPHLRQIAEYLPCLDPNARVELLIGRDVPDVHHVLNQVLGGQGKPFAQQLPLGWVVIGEVCLGKVHPPPAIVRKTNVLVDGRSTLFPLCDLSFEVKEANDIFVRTPDDNKVGLSVEDKQFIELMNDHFVMDDTGHWSAPLPFRKAKISMPNNRPLAWKRALILDSSLRRDSVKAEHFKTFMNKVFASGAVEVAPSLPENSECWYLPLFGVYHPKKPDQIRGVFDSSAVFQGTSLN